MHTIPDDHEIYLLRAPECGPQMLVGRDRSDLVRRYVAGHAGFQRTVDPSTVSVVQITAGGA